MDVSVRVQSPSAHANNFCLFFNSLVKDTCCHCIPILPPCVYICIWYVHVLLDLCAKGCSYTAVLKDVPMWITASRQTLNRDQGRWYTCCEDGGPQILRVRAYLVEVVKGHLGIIHPVGFRRYDLISLQSNDRRNSEHTFCILQHIHIVMMTKSDCTTSLNCVNTLGCELKFFSTIELHTQTYKSLKIGYRIYFWITFYSFKHILKNVVIF